MLTPSFGCVGSDVFPKQIRDFLSASMLGEPWEFGFFSSAPVAKSLQADGHQEVRVQERAQMYTILTYVNEHSHFYKWEIKYSLLLCQS